MTAHHAWHRAAFLNAKAHAAPGVLMADMMHDLLSRGCTLHSDPIVPVKRIKTWSLDLGGAIHTSAPWGSVRVDNLTLDFPSWQAIEVRNGLRRKCPPRTFASGRIYYKFHGHWACLVMLPRQYEALLTEMERIALAEDAKADEFFKALRRFDERSAS